MLNGITEKNEFITKKPTERQKTRSINDEI